MSLGRNDILSFYNDKSIAHSYNFYVDFSFLDHAGYVKPYHVVDVEIPTNKFQRESVNYGVTQYSYPVLAKEQPLDLKITFEEDRRGVIAGMIHEMQNRICTNGLHYSPHSMRLGHIRVTLYDDQKMRLSRWTYRDVFFLGYDNVSLSYDSNESVKYSVTFGSDVVIYSNMYRSSLNDTPLDLNVSDSYSFKSIVDANNINEYSILSGEIASYKGL